MGSAIDVALWDAQGQTGPRVKSSPPVSAHARDDLKDSLQSSRRDAEQVKNALDSLKMAAKLTGVDLNDDDIKIGMNMIIVDDRFREL